MRLTGWLIFAQLLGGCAAPAAIPASQELHSRAGSVYLMSGWMGISSSGIEALAARIRDAGIETHAFNESDWHKLVRQIKAQQPASNEPLILIGHSYGADNSLRAARDLRADKIGVDLIITIDPTTPPSVPENVKRCINIYQSNGAWDAFPWFRGIPLHPDDSNSTTVITNWDVRVDRTDLLEPDTDHFTIPKSPLVHAEVLSKVLEVCPQKVPSGAGN